MSESLLFAFALVATGATIFLFVYFIIELSDLECDFLNSQQCCSNLNMKFKNDCTKGRYSKFALHNFIFETNTSTVGNLHVLWVIPKLGVHVFLTVLLFLYWHWLLALANLPLAIWMGYEYHTIPKGNMGVYDPTEIHNRGQLKKHMKASMIYLGYYLIFFFVYLYCLIISLLKGNPLERADPEMTAF